MASSMAPVSRLPRNRGAACIHVKVRVRQEDQYDLERSLLPYKVWSGHGRVLCYNT